MANHWELLSKGDVVVSNTPEGLWQQACEYFLWCDDHPIKAKKTLTSGKEAGTRVKLEMTRPYTVKGLCIHCGIVEEYLKDLRNSKAKDSLYYIVVSRILYIIYVQNVENATVGLFNPIFTAKMLNIGQDDSQAGSIKVELISKGIPALSKSENEVLEKIDFENSVFENDD